MTKVMVLSLAETTGNKFTGYAIIGKNLDNDSWVIIPTLPKELLKTNGEYAWDIFAVTEVDLRRIMSNRGDEYEVDTSNYFPYMIEPPIKSNHKRKEILDGISSDCINDLTSSPSWVGILKEPIIKDITFVERRQDHFNYDENQTFFWECRLDFSDRLGYKWRYKAGRGVAVKDMRFKAYWRDLCLNRREAFEISKKKWIDYMMQNDTYLLVEFYASHRLGTVTVISGVLSINKNEAGEV